MTRLEKIEHLLNKGYKYFPDTGFIFSGNGKHIIKTTLNGYIQLSLYKDGKRYNLVGHQFAWYWVHKEIVECIDHVNNIKTDNRISNLRSVSKSQNASNLKKEVGASFCKRSKKWISKIMVNYKGVQLGTFNTKQEALDCYKLNKNKYHKI